MTKGVSCPYCGSYKVSEAFSFPSKALGDDPIENLPGTNGPIVSKPTLNPIGPKEDGSKGKKYHCLSCGRWFD